jgi:hypothetical protein
MDELHLERAQWRKSSYSSANGACVEVARNPPGRVAVRDSKNPNGSKLVFSLTDWRAFLAQRKHWAGVL